MSSRRIALRGGGAGRRRLRFERLERREVLDGTVTVTLNGAGNLRLVGDADANAVEIYFNSGSGAIEITDPDPDLDSSGFADLDEDAHVTRFVYAPDPLLPDEVSAYGLPTSGLASFALVGAFVNNVDIQLNGGHDLVILSGGLAIGGRLTIQTGSGNDVVAIGDMEESIGTTPVYSVTSPLAPLTAILLPPTPGGVDIDGNITIQTGAGHDEVYFSNVSAPRANIVTAAGDDLVHILRSPSGDATEIATGLTVDLGGGSNQFEVSEDGGSDTLEVTTLNVVSGSGDDTIALGDVHVDGNLNVQTGAGDDSITFTRVFAGGRANVNTNSGTDSVTLDDVELGSLRLNLGADDDTLTITDGPLTIGLVGSLVDGGLGTDTLDDPLDQLPPPFPFRFEVQT